jgi:fumarylacetoacetase
LAWHDPKNHYNENRPYTKSELNMTAIVVDPALRSFIKVEPESPFPIQNLPYGVFRPRGGPARVGIAIGEFVLDLAALQEAKLLPFASSREGGEAIFSGSSLNAFLSLGQTAWRQVRQRLVELLREDEPTLRDDKSLRKKAFIAQSDVELLLPAEIGDYTDFFSSREHATNTGTMMRGLENALQPNWLHLPVAYHGRASSIVISGTDVRRPCGQTMPEGASRPKFGPSRALDFELEMGLFIGPENPLGQPIPVERATEHVFGLVLVNDWSARDIQKWEYVPLGPFLSKNFATGISPWVVTVDALLPFRVPGPKQDPEPLPYLRSSGDWAFDIQLQASLQGPRMKQPDVICRTNFRYMYWNICQQVAHHTITGCNLRPGDLLASGTISGPTPDSRGCLLERTWGGREPLSLSDGTQRRFLEDGDRVTFSAWCQGDGHRVGFGEVTGSVLPAVTD